MSHKPEDSITDALLRREVFLQRFASHLVNTDLNGTIQAFSRKLPSLLSEFGDAEDLTITERRAITKLVTAQMTEDWGSMWIDITDDLNEMALNDTAHVKSIYVDIANVSLAVPKDSILLGHIKNSTMLLTSGSTDSPKSTAGVWAKYVRNNTDAATEAVNGAIWNGYSNNLTNNQIAQQVRGKFNRRTKTFEGGILQGRTRAQGDALVRTGVTHFSNQARDRMYQANTDILEKRILFATMDSRTSPICIRRHLREWDITDKSYPRIPFHFNCLLPDTVITSSLPISSISKRAFKGEVVNIITKSGNSLTVTPNHPILSDSGWVFAKLLTVGDNVFSHTDSEPVLTWDGCNNYVDTSIKDIFESLRVSGGMLTSEVPLTAPDFHGDTHNGEVAVILSDVNLSNVLNGSIIKEFGEEILVKGCSDVSSFISSFSHFLQRFITNGFASVKLSSSFTDSLSRFITKHGTVDFVLLCKGSYLDSLVFNEISKHLSVEAKSFTDICNAISFIIKINNFIELRLVHNIGCESSLFTSGSYIDSIFREDFLDRGCVVSSRIIDSHDAKSTIIKSDNIVTIKFIHYDGPVYNLETLGGIYSANNIVNHNCRSVYVIKAKGFDPLDGDRPSVGGKLNGKGELIKDVNFIPADTTWDSFLRRQPRAFIEETIGKSRAALFIDGKLNINKFTDMTGKSITLKDLKAKPSLKSAFEKAGLSD